MITIRVSYCPKCRNSYDMNVVGLSTGLGPSIARCSNCKTVFDSGKKEWFQMSSIEKATFWILSSLYATIFGGICGILLSCLIRFVLYGKVINWPPLYSPISILLIGICFFSFIIFVIYAQIKRIINSNSRSFRKAMNLNPVLTSFMSFELGLQLKFVYLYSILFGVLGLLMTYYK